ncbi:hypothetical protein OROMI_008819 [Orobanche minor]
MAPRKAASAGADDQCPTMKLIMEKGPLSGQINQFGSGTRIHIGRVVRGNTLSIKDAGISTKHLVIQVETVTGHHRCWTITDLKSSNGTFLNGERLEPSEPAALSDGDVIIIGEQTSIQVKFEVNAGEIEVNTRKVRRGGRKQVEELGVIDEDSELGLGIKNLGSGFGNEKCVDLGNECGKLGDVKEEKESGRRTRGSRARELENGNKGVIESVGKVSLRRTRGSKKDESLENLMTNPNDDDDEKNNAIAGVEVKQGRNVVTRSRSSNNNENLSKDLNIDGNKILEPIVGKGNERVSMRRTRSSRKEENSDNPLIDLGVTEGKRTGKGTRGRKKLPVVTSLDEKDKEESNLEEQKLCEEEKRIPEDGVDEGVTCERENVTASASTSGVKEKAVEVGNGGVMADLEKMTLGEWLDFLYDYLPKQIIDETEQMISEMKQQAERVHEFMVQQKNGMGKSDVAMDK